MATVEVDSPVDILADRAVDTLGFYTNFIQETYLPAVTLASADTGSSRTAGTVSSNIGATDYVFPLDSEAFHTLQAYLVSGMKLPPSVKHFEKLYPRSLIEEYTKKHSADFYDDLANVLVEINNHCTTFKTETMNNAVKLGGTIARFADEAAESSIVLTDSLKIMTRSGIRSDDPAFENAVTNFSATMDSLVSRARAAKEGCEKAYNGLSRFQDITLIDGVNIRRVNEIADRVIPPTTDLDREMAERADKAYKELAKLVRRQKEVLERDYYRMLLATKQRGPLQFFGEGFLLKLSGSLKEQSMNTEFAIATKEYEKVFQECSAYLQKTIRIRAATSSLSTTIDEVLGKIGAVQEALQNMIGAFSNLISNLQNIDDDLQNALTASQSKLKPKRAAAFNHLEKAGAKWKLVLHLAQDFEKHGHPVVQDVNSDTILNFAPSVEILGATYGGSDVTRLAEVLFFHGTGLKIRTMELGFEDPWKDTNPRRKTLTLLHQHGDSMRILSCVDGEDIGALYKTDGMERALYINPGPVEEYFWPYCELREIRPTPTSKHRIPGSKIEILAVVWGVDIVTDRDVFQMIHDVYARKGKITFTAEALDNGFVRYDPFFLMEKGNLTGTIYYRVIDGGSIRQLSGRVGTSVGFFD